MISNKDVVGSGGTQTRTVLVVVEHQQGRCRLWGNSGKDGVANGGTQIRTMYVVVELKQGGVGIGGNQTETVSVLVELKQGRCRFVCYLARKTRFLVEFLPLYGQHLSTWE